MAITTPRWPIIDGVDLSTHDHSGSSPNSDQTARLAARDRRRQVTYLKDAADAAAATATAETCFGQAPFNEAVTVTACRISLNAALTGAAVDNATINVYKRSGATQTLLATITTTANIAAFVSTAVVLSVVVGALAVAASNTFTFEIVKNGLGVVIPAGTSITLEYTVN